MTEENENGASVLFNLLWESRWKDDVKIIVETTKETVLSQNFVLCFLRGNVGEWLLTKSFYHDPQ